MDLQKGGSAGSRRRTVIGLDHQLGPIKRSMDGKVRPVVQQSVDLSWVQVTTSAECAKSIKILPVPGRSYERGRKGAHRSSNQPVKTDRHSSFK
jgi:hypothetical protein